MNNKFAISMVNLDEYYITEDYNEIEITIECDHMPDFDEAKRLVRTSPKYIFALSEGLTDVFGITPDDNYCVR